MRRLDPLPLKAADANGTGLAKYAKANDLKVKDLYQWKTSLVFRGQFTYLYSKDSLLR